MTNDICDNHVTLETADQTSGLVWTVCGGMVPAVEISSVFLSMFGVKLLVATKAAWHPRKGKLKDPH